MARSNRHRGPTSLQRAVGTAFLCLSALMSLILVLQHFGGLSLPGCGEGSDCAEVANSVWGKIPLGGIQWPVSFVGFAYFLGVLVAWIGSGGALPRSFRYFVRFGALVSVGLSIILISKRMFCPYCVGTHIGNLAFWLTMELSRRAAAPSRFVLRGFIAAFVLVTAVLGVLDVQHRRSVREKAEDQRREATQEIIDRAGGPDTTTEHAPLSPEEPAQTASTGPAFTGRYRVGPEKAPIRIVIFTDYQCRDCYEIEGQLKQLHKERNDISISVKHFPFNANCNQFVSKTLHPNACWAARAAEAAGILWGPEGFWKMHTWLFERRGVFETTQVLEDGIRQMGYDPAGFTTVMTGDETLESVRADTKEAKRLGIHFTPMIFINGVELKGWNAPNALVRTVEQVAATNPPARSAAFDRPAVAFEKYVEDWRQQPRISLPPDSRSWTLGPRDAPVKVVMWGDYQHEVTARADSIIRASAAGEASVLYAYRHYPINSDCNPKIKERRHGNACRAARAAEAAGHVAGSEGYWKMHTWLMESQGTFDDPALRQALEDLGLDRDTFFDAMAQSELEQSILEDVEAGNQLPRLRHGMPPGIYGLPTIFVNERFVPRWSLDGRSLLREILEEAAEE